MALRATFGPSALATPANAVTIARLLITPLLVGVVLRDGATWGAWVVWTLLASTDGVDGWIARRMGTTRSGAFLDPLADKALVLGALFALAVVGTFGWVPVLLIAGREAFISVYRSRLARRGVSVPARPLAKAKTIVQAVAVGLALLPPLEARPLAAQVTLWAAVALALASGGQYLFDGERGARARQDERDGEGAASAL